METKNGFEKLHSKSELKWDLFNPKPEFNFSKMAKNLDITTLDNPYVQVIWEDNAENFTQERIKSVKQYFLKKYGSTNVNVITKVKTNEDTQHTIDVSINIMDKNYQKELIQSCLKSKNIQPHYEKIMNEDFLVENKMTANDIAIVP